ncbi:MAG: long-chain fatty acid--CoA ligase [Sulfuricurvum sp. RIFCSPLOWO2_02_FULL_43_45]|nr:MAG: long-chain fatty acid--CoA ligase [Sulfuricurvum sp. RIFCSPLOWO2_02_43_6]OHD86423.1 MAG: long-chain fatty acid--CoA ligase [Sulfuricurvum sp. RIFCSPLOWO2_02_FULL_43_45]OHD89625.1 MAG: long-chain fatty acid--CoA ligase [Sulfuricurvum sp. RIFCSPLOWO2_12_FULL_43_24]
MHYPYENFYAMLERVTEENPSKRVIFIDDKSFSYQSFLENVDRFARALELIGISKGERIALICPNGIEFVQSVFAISKLGAITVPLNTMLKNEEYRYILGDCGAKILITASKFAKEVRNLSETVETIEHTIWIDQAPIEDSQHLVLDEILSDHLHTHRPSPAKLDDTAVIFYTSGTTGHPKGAMISNRNLFSNLVGAKERFDLCSSDRFIVYLPMFHSFTFSIMVMLPFFTRSSFVIIPSILPFSNIIKQTLLKRVTIFMGVPDIYNALIRAKLPWYFLWFNSIRCFISGGSALSEDTLNRFRSTFKRATMLEGYGLSECSPAVAINPLEKQKTLSVGLPLYGYEVKIVNDEMLELPIGEAGELIVRGDCVMQGYLNNPDATAETIQNGWLRTGDIAKVDKEGYIYIVDRIKDLIISKGINIYPRQIEEQMMLLPQIKLAAVIGMNDPHSGEVPIAFVELEEGYEDTTQAFIKSQLKEHLAAFKIPKTITVVESLPKTATGKVLKRVLKQGLN